MTARPERGERTMVVWCPDWPVVAAGVPAEVPAAVLFANRVVACSPSARAEGVARGIRRREAQGRCPELVIVEADPARDARAFEPVAAAVEAFAPRLEIDRPGRCAVATRGPSRYFGGDDTLAAQVAAAVAATGSASGPTVCRVGIADGRFAAGLAARVGRVVEPGTSAAFLAPFPVSALDRPELADLLRRLGLRTLGALARLPAADVLARFGTDGALAHRLARGLDERPLAARTPPPDFSVAMELDPPAVRVDTAAFAAKALADSLHAALADRGLACTRIAIEAETEHGETHSRLWRHDGALTPGAMAERVRWQLDGWLHASASGGDERPTAGITLIRLVPDEVRPDTGRQLGFWGGAAEGDERAARALARVQGMLGPDGVCTAVLGGGRSPAEQVRLVSWGDAREAARPGGVEGGAVANPAGWREIPPWPGQVPPPAPATVHLAAVPAEVVAEDGRPVRVSGRGMLAAPPARLSVDGGPWQPVEAWAGPWLVDERWWDLGAHRRRARFQLLTAAGTALLAALEGGRWWIEATYD